MVYDLLNNQDNVENLDQNINADTDQMNRQRYRKYSMVHNIAMTVLMFIILAILTFVAVTVSNFYNHIRRLEYIVNALCPALLNPNECRV